MQTLSKFNLFLVHFLLTIYTTMEDFILSFSAPKIVSEIKVITGSSAFETVSEEVVAPEAGEYSYALAA